ncbi:B3 domain-containing protein Os07g0679700-like isoform X2 [Nymphaea colorata]|uniref:B3 domain-containing protein Os07g0679700-like isoform X2 n=1 Tax=Nymphaea colorata TaxID=210225 RepID=UPI00129EFA4A|nr:B3 domain-containing protein Os07g0679700-like isoform X2 [Nymphaea colorata]
MGSRVCMNPCCGSTSTSRWMDGWPLRAGGFANLCEACGDAYKKSTFCNMFHESESGWRNCKSCGKRLHCGCIASKSMFELLDGGGVECTNCTKNSSHSLTHCAGQLATSPPSYTAQCLSSRCSSDERKNGMSMSQQNDAGGIMSSALGAKLGSISMKGGYVWQSSRDAQGSLKNCKVSEQTGGMGVSVEKIKREQGASVAEPGSACFPNMCTIGLSQSLNQDTHESFVTDRETYGSLTSAYLNITLGTSNSASSVRPDNALNKTKLISSSSEGREQIRTPFSQGQRSRHPLLKPASTSPSTGSESSKDVAPQIRVARPPGEGRGRNQLLPRYWPRITDQELQQISGDSNSKIVPLFEKVLSASDAGRIGRLVLPKACAEAYFPPISQPEGLPLTIQDAKGKEWLFQFRFWPNNNSRMYVLEGVTPCIQSMQLQAGDTVTFSRIDPEGKLVMGFRKATTSSSIPGSSQVATTGNGRVAAEKNGGRSKEEVQLQHFQVQEKKRARNLGSKSKRLIIDKHDAMQLKITWEEAQDLLRPPPSVKPSIVMIEDHEFEEYEEPPVFGKMTLFTSSPSGEHDQWAQCDGCSKWRRVPMDALIPPRWTCTDNSWDPKRSSCSALDEPTSNMIEDTKKSIEELHKLNRDIKKRRSIGSPKLIPRDMSALDALATAAVLGENGDTTPSTATTTKHPRHRPGCSCIVCIQPPSGKGPKHKPTCTCNVCMTVRRRFKTLMMRRKKRQSERETDTARKKNTWTKEDGDVESVPKCSIRIDASSNETKQAHTPDSSIHKVVTEREEMGNILKVPTKDETKGQIDLNCDPDREEDLLPGPSTPGVSMMTLLQVASLPLDTYLKQHGLTSLVGDQQTRSSVPLPGKESETKPDESHFAPLQEQVAAAAEAAHLPVDQMKNEAT